jgi:hypothetical protein
LFVVGGFDELVDQLASLGVADAVAGLGGLDSKWLGLSIIPQGDNYFLGDTPRF